MFMFCRLILKLMFLLSDGRVLIFLRLWLVEIKKIFVVMFLRELCRIVYMRLFMYLFWRWIKMCLIEYFCLLLFRMIWLKCLFWYLVVWMLSFCMSSFCMLWIMVWMICFFFCWESLKECVEIVGIRGWCGF